MQTGSKSAPESSIPQTLKRLSRSEPFAVSFGIKCLDAGPGFAVCEMTVGEEMKNLFGTAHGGAVFALIDETFQIACNTWGISACALNVSVTYVSAAMPGETLRAEAREMSKTTRTGLYEIRVTSNGGNLVASAQALAYRRKEPPPFLCGG